MNANVVTAKQTDAPVGIDRVPDCRGFGTPRQFEHRALTSRPPAGEAALQDWSASTPHHGLDFTWFFEFREPLYFRLYPGSYPRSSADRKSTVEATCQPLRPTLIRKEIGQPLLPPDSLPSRDVTTRQQALNQKASQPGRWLRRFGGFAG